MPFPAGLFLGTIAGGAALTAARWWRRRRASRFEAELQARWPLAHDGIIAGAAGFTLERPNAPAVLLLHGFGDTPASLRYFAEALHAEGYAVHVPLLPGHGRTLRDFAVVSAEGWLDAARSALAALRARHEWVAVAGLSMGAALGVSLAADDELGAGVPALVLLAPYLVPAGVVRIGARLSRVWGAVVPYLRTVDPRSIQDEIERARALGYGAVTPAALRALVHTADVAYDALPRVTAPTLVVLSRHDNRVAAASAERAFARLGAREKRMRWREIGGHILPVDHGRDEVFVLTLEWLAAHGGIVRSSERRPIARG